MDTKVEVKTVKPGYKTSEFWMTAVMQVCGLVMASGIVHEGSQLERIVGGLLAALATLGYNISRGTAKK